MSIGLGILLGLTARTPSAHGLGLLGVVAVMVGMGSTRALGMALDGDSNASMYAYLALEVLMASAAYSLFRRTFSK
jgi:hydrogenase/urease accessory protein HupE